MTSDHTRILGYLCRALSAVPCLAREQSSYENLDPFLLALLGFDFHVVKTSAEILSIDLSFAWSAWMGGGKYGFLDLMSP